MNCIVTTTGLKVYVGQESGTEVIKHERAIHSTPDLVQKNQKESKLPITPRQGTAVSLVFMQMKETVMATLCHKHSKDLCVYMSTKNRKSHLFKCLAGST